MADSASNPGLGQMAWHSSNANDYICTCPNVDTKPRKPIATAAALLGVREETFPEEILAMASAASGCNGCHIGTTASPGAAEDKIGLIVLLNSMGLLSKPV